MVVLTSKESPLAKPPKKNVEVPARKAKPAARVSKKKTVGFRGWMKAFGRSLVVGTLLAGGIVGWVQYDWAERKVEQGLAAPVWTVPGKVTSAPIEIWPGLELEPEELASDLSSAGYARVARASQAGDFSVANNALMVSRREASGPGYEIKTGEVLVTFKDGRVESVTPGGKLTVPPSTLTLVRGKDNENRSPVPLDHIPEIMQRAVLAIEDSRFYDHEGVDPVGIARAMFRNAMAQQWEQGGSTLTQQLVKNVFLSHERTAERKWREALISMAIERKLSKDEILALYLNEIYLGQSGGSSVCGVDAASRAYFGKPIERVTMTEAATIAGMIASPNPYHPVRHPEASRVRRDLVIDRLVTLGWSTQADADKAKKIGVVTHAATGGRTAPWAVDLAVESAEAGDEGRVARDALVVQTTIHPQLQRLAERAVSKGVAELVADYPKLSGVQMALVAVRARDGAIVAMVGGKDYGESAFNRVVNSPRPVGSTVKALTMLAAFEGDPTLSPATVLDDSPIERTVDGKVWSPSNYDGRFAGPIPLREAVAKSRNVPAVLLAERVGLETLKGRLRALGLSKATAFPSASLGGFSATPEELAGAYTVFAADGAYHAPFVLRSVSMGDARLIDQAPVKATTRYSARSTFLARDVMRSVVSEGTAKSAKKYGVGAGAAGKTGTTDDYADAWFAGVAGPYSVVVWVGFDTPASTGLTGGVAALPTWSRFVAGTGLDGVIPPVPDDVIQVEVCESTGLPPCADCEIKRSEWFAIEAVPEPKCGVFDDPGEALKTGWQKLGQLFGLSG